MKTISVVFVTSAFAVSVLAGDSNKPAPQMKGSPPPPVALAPANPAAGETYVYQQTPQNTRPVLVSQEQAKSVLERFRAAYPKLNNPRMLIYVNRDLVDDLSGYRLAGRTEKTESSKSAYQHEFKADGTATPAAASVTGSNVVVVGDVRAGASSNPGRGAASSSAEKVTSENNYTVGPGKAATLADKQTVRDIERLFGRPLRMGGATLADQRVATQMTAASPIQPNSLVTEGEQARKDREALSKVCDVVVEVLISSRNVTVPGIAQDTVLSAPDIQATAIRLSDARVLGQATASDVLGPDHSAGPALRSYTVREIAEATALALMEDMMLGVQ